MLNSVTSTARLTSERCGNACSRSMRRRWSVTGQRLNRPSRALAYTRIESPPVGHIVVIPNLLDAHWRGYGPHIGGTAFVVVGPTGDKPDVGLVQHEALHSLVGPLVESHRNVIASAQAERLFNRLRSAVDAKSYGTWPAIPEESVINAVGVRLAEPEWRSTALHNDEARGFWLTRALAQKLAEYQLSEETLADYMPELLASLNQLNADELGPEEMPRTLAP